MGIGRRIALVLTLLAATAPSVDLRAAQPAVQADSEATRIDAQLDEARALFAKGDHDEAGRRYEAALGAATTAGLDGRRARALLGVASVRYARRQTAAAEPPAREALAIFDRLGLREGVGRTSHLLSVITEATGRQDEARQLAERAVQELAGSTDVRARIRASLQLVDLSNPPVDQMRLALERLAGEAAGAADVGMQAIVVHSLGDRLFGASRFEEALEAYHRAAALFRQAGDESSLGAVYNSLGRLYRVHGRYEEALKFQRDALALHEKGGRPYYHVQSLNAVAVVEGLLGNAAASRAYYERALAVAEQMGSTETRDFLRANLGGLLLEEGRYAEAAKAYETVLAGDPGPFASARYGQLADAYLGLGRPRDALAAAERSLALCGTASNPCVNSLSDRARAHAASGNLPAALEDVEASLAELDALRAKLVPTDFFRQNFPLAYQRTYGVAIALQLEGGHVERSLEAAERGRARAFLDLLSVKQLAPKDPPASIRPAEAPGAVVARDTSGHAATVTLTMRGGDTPPAATTPAAATTPSVATGLSGPSTLERLAATAARLQSTLVSYWVADAEVFIWVVSPAGSVQSRRVQVLRSQLERLIRETSPFGSPGAAPDTAPGLAVGASTSAALPTRGAMTVAPGRPSGDAWRALHRLLIAPIRDALPRTPGALLTIVPHGPLLNLSFAALQDARGRYLLEDHALHYAPAGALLDFTASRRRADARTGPLLLVSDPALPPVSGLDRPLPRLPGARQEAQAIGRLLPQQQVIALQDAGATEAGIRTAAADKAVLHFATHAIVRDTDPFVSYLALGRSSAGSEGDGLLTAEEIYGLDLDADLVVLSACRSGGGTVRGDGVSTFARAFTYAGTASVLASVWDVADEPTNRLLPAFYRAWLGGAAKAHALRRAQLSLLRDLRAGRVRVATAIGPATLPEHPVFWAGFALFGEPD